MVLWRHAENNPGVGTPLTEFVHIAGNACSGINGDMDVYFFNCNESIMQKTIQGQGHRSHSLYTLLRNMYLGNIKVKLARPRYREYSDAENTTEGLYIVGQWPCM